MPTSPFSSPFFSFFSEFPLILALISLPFSLFSSVLQVCSTAWQLFIYTARPQLARGSHIEQQSINPIARNLVRKLSVPCHFHQFSRLKKDKDVNRRTLSNKRSLSGQEKNRRRKASLTTTKDQSGWYCGLDPNFSTPPSLLWSSFF